MIDDVDVWPLLGRLRDSVLREVTRSGAAPLGAFAVYPGREPVLDEGCSSFGYVVATAVFPTQTFPTPAVTPEASCASSLAVAVEVGIWRCAPMPKSARRGEYVAAPASEQYEAARVQFADMALLRRAVLNAGFTDMALGTYLPAGPAGGLVGGYWTATVGG